MRSTRKYIAPKLSKSDFSYNFTKDSIGKIVCFALIAYMFFIAIVMLSDLIR